MELGEAGDELKAFPSATSILHGWRRSLSPSHLSIICGAGRSRNSGDRIVWSTGVKFSCELKPTSGYCRSPLLVF